MTHKAGEKPCFHQVYSRENNFDALTLLFVYAADVRENKSYVYVSCSFTAKSLNTRRYILFHATVNTANQETGTSLETRLYYTHGMYFLWHGIK